MTTRLAKWLGGTVAVGAVVMALSGCAPVEHTYAANGRCLHFQLSVTAEVHPGSTTGSPSWDLAFTNTSPVACVFGGVPTVRFRGSTASIGAGTVSRAESDDMAVQVGAGDTAYAHIELSRPAGGCAAVRVGSIAVVAPHVAGGGWVLTPPARFNGCAGSVTVASVGNVTSHRSK